MTPEQISAAQKMSREFRPRSGFARNGEETNMAVIDPGSTGSGFFVSSDGFFVTPAHVLEGGTRFEVSLGGRSFAARVVLRDDANDLALLKCDGSFRGVPVRSSGRARLGERVSTVGFPNPDLQGQAAKFTAGSISSLSGPQDDPRFFQVSIPVQPGNSGGPLLDATGAAIGVIAARLDERIALTASGSLPENVNYAVKGSHLLAFLESIPNLESTITKVSDRVLTDAGIAAAAEVSCGLVLVYH